MAYQVQQYRLHTRYVCVHSHQSYEIAYLALEIKILGAMYVSFSTNKVAGGGLDILFVHRS